jgi:hypothetical protein
MSSYMHKRPYYPSTSDVSSTATETLERPPYIAKHDAVDTDQLCKFPVPFVYLACATPETCRDTHRREDAIVVEQEALERFFDPD